MIDDEHVALVARALANPVRIHLVRLLASQAECRGADVFGELPLAQSTISEHLRILKDADIVNARHEGTAMVYCLTPGALDGFLEAISEIAFSSACCVANGKVC